MAIDSSCDLKVSVSLLVLLLTPLAVPEPQDKRSPFKDIRTCLLDAGVFKNRIVQRTISNNTHAYSQLNYQWNLRRGLKTPLGYLLANSTSDVQAAVKCCKPLNVRVVAKGGGQSYEKYSFGDSKSLIVDLQLMDSILVNPKRKICHVGPGVLTGQLAWTLYSSHGVVVPHGSCPTVGISGLALGGGRGHLSRLYGLTADNIVELEMVDSTGSVVNANKESNTDLLWALRGAGTGSYGIVTRFIFKTYATPKMVCLGTIKYDLLMFPHVFGKWQDLLRSKPAKQLSAWLAIEKGQVIVRVANVQGAEGERQEEAAVNNILNAFPPQARGNSSVASLTYEKFLFVSAQPRGLGLKNPSGLANLTRHSFKQRIFKSKSFFVSKFIGYVDMVSILLLLEQMPRDVTIDMHMGGGEVDRLQPNSTAFVHRVPNLFIVQTFYNGKLDHPKTETVRALIWLGEFFETTKRIISHTESYQNYVDSDDDMKDYLQRYYGSNLKRLVQIKREVDPDNYFRNPQSIPPSL